MLWLDHEALASIAKVAEGSIIHNILTQTQASGTPLKRNAPSTVREKIRRGWLVAGRALSLVAHLKRFVRGNGQSWRAIIDVAKQQIIIRPLSVELALLSLYVQRKGYTGWFAIGTAGRAAMRAVIRQWVDRQFRRAGSGA